MAIGTGTAGAITIADIVVPSGFPANKHITPSIIKVESLFTWSGVQLSRLPLAQVMYQLKVTSTQAVVKTVNAYFTYLPTTSGSLTETQYLYFSTAGLTDGVGYTITANAFLDDGNPGEVIATSTATYSFTYYAYSAPTIPTFTIQRCQQNGTLDDSGTYVKAGLSYVCSPIGNTNTKQLKLWMKAKSSGSWILDQTYTLAGLGLEYTKTIDAAVTTATYAADTAYDVKLEFVDLVNTVNNSSSVDVSVVTYDVDVVNHKFAIGKRVEATSPQLDVAGGARFGDVAYTNAGLMPVCLFQTPTSEDIVFNSTLRYWIFDWHLTQNGGFTSFKGGVSSARDMGVVIPATGYYRMSFILFLNKASSSSSSSAFICRMPSTFSPPTTVNYMTQAQCIDVATEYRVMRALAYNSTYTHVFMTVDMYCTAGDKIMPTAYVGDISKTIASGQTEFSIQRIG